MCDEKKGEFFYLVELRFFLLKDSKKLAIGGGATRMYEYVYAGEAKANS